VSDTAHPDSSLADTPELVGFFSYSRDDDDESHGALSALRDAIQRELREQLDRSRQQLRLWQANEAIAPGRSWESEIKSAIDQSVFFIPIITPTMVKNRDCQTEFECFLERQRQLGRGDLVFPILYVGVPELETEVRWRDHPVLSVIGARQWMDWRHLRSLPVDDAAVCQAIKQFCATIVATLHAPMVLFLPPTFKFYWRGLLKRLGAAISALAVVLLALVVAPRHVSDSPPTTAVSSLTAAEAWAKGREAANRKDYAEALRWYRIAADQGYAAAQTGLGRVYRDGDWGVAQDYAEAMRWYRKAADQGDAIGQFNVAWFYQKGHGVAQDYAEAMRWYRKAADQGDADAQRQIGLLYRNGWGVPQDYAEAMRWFNKAADQGNSSAQYHIGELYQNGQGTAQDYAEAMRWYRKAADQGDADAQSQIGLLYRNGWGVPQDYAEALRWYHKAADQNDAGGCSELLAHTATPLASHKTMPRRCAGTARPPIKAVPRECIMSARSTSMALASRWTTRRPCAGINGQPTMARNSPWRQSATSTATARVSRRITRRLCAGTARPPTKDMPRRKTVSGGCW